jgi:hypothetical protein
MLKVLMLLISSPAVIPAADTNTPFDASGLMFLSTAIPADAGATFDASGLDAALVPPYNHSC